MIRFDAEGKVDRSALDDLHPTHRLIDLADALDAHRAALAELVRVEDEYSKKCDSQEWVSRHEAAWAAARALLAPRTP